jgi:hypothetical protein
MISLSRRCKNRSHRQDRTSTAIGKRGNKHSYERHTDYRSRGLGVLERRECVGRKREDRRCVGSRRESISPPRAGINSNKVDNQAHTTRGEHRGQHCSSNTVNREGGRRPSRDHWSNTAGGHKCWQELTSTSKLRSKVGSCKNNMKYWRSWGIGWGQGGSCWGKEGGNWGTGWGLRGRRWGMGGESWGAGRGPEGRSRGKGGGSWRIGCRSWGKGKYSWRKEDNNRSKRGSSWTGRLCSWTNSLWEAGSKKVTTQKNTKHWKKENTRWKKKKKRRYQTSPKNKKTQKKQKKNIKKEKRTHTYIYVTKSIETKNAKIRYF